MNPLGSLFFSGVAFVISASGFFAPAWQGAENEAEGSRDCRAVQEAALEILDMVRETLGELRLRALEQLISINISMPDRS